MKSTSSVTSAGATELDLERLDAMVTSLVGKLGFSPSVNQDSQIAHPHPVALVTAISIIVQPHNLDELRALSGGKAGVTDGRTLWLDQKVLADHVNQKSSCADVDAWFSECLETVAAFAMGRGHSSSILATVSSSELLKALASVLDTRRADWREFLGYGQANSPLPNALANTLPAFGSELGSGDDLLPPPTPLEPEQFGRHNALAALTLRALRAPVEVEAFLGATTEHQQADLHEMVVQCNRQFDVYTPALQYPYLFGHMHQRLGVFLSSPGVQDGPGCLMRNKQIFMDALVASDSTTVKIRDLSLKGLTGIPHYENPFSNLDPGERPRTAKPKGP